MTTTFDFKGSNVFVFGGTSGINLGIARCFATAGANVAVASRSQEKVDAAVAELKSLGSEASGYALDVRDAEAVQAALAGHDSSTGTIDILVSGAAGNFPALANDMSPNGFKSVVDIDLLGSFHVLRSAFQYLKKPGASVINISAPQAFVPMPMQSHVCAAKAGVDMLTRTLALEAPSEAIANQYKKSVPLQRFGSVDEIGQAAMFLSSDVAQYISGVVLPVDGGWSVAGASAAALAMAQHAGGK
jgi:NAD(P)-dependent dehydrogenase (short-subunit alcohol dehydrogenase family)